MAFLIKGVNPIIIIGVELGDVARGYPLVDLFADPLGPPVRFNSGGGPCARDRSKVQIWWTSQAMILRSYQVGMFGYLKDP